MKLRVDEKDALVIVDVQRDFCSGGALPVPRCDQVVPVLNEYVQTFREAGAKIYATRDWHPPNHCSFRDYGGIWPVHCVQRTVGAKFHSNLLLPPAVKIISKATSPSRESYSGFDGTKLQEDLNENRIKRIFIGGLATDYCVKNTVLDALKLEFEAVVLLDAIGGVDLRPSDSDDAIKEMIKKGARTATLPDIHTCS